MENIFQINHCWSFILRENSASMNKICWNVYCRVLNVCVCVCVRVCVEGGGGFLPSMTPCVTAAPTGVHRGAPGNLSNHPHPNEILKRPWHPSGSPGCWGTPVDQRLNLSEIWIVNGNRDVAVLEKVFGRKNLACSSNIEIPYFSTKQNIIGKVICIFCGKGGKICNRVSEVKQLQR